jgi:hypothetical protein
MKAAARAVRCIDQSCTATSRRSVSSGNRLVTSVSSKGKANYSDVSPCVAVTSLAAMLLASHMLQEENMV